VGIHLRAAPIRVLPAAGALSRPDRRECWLSLPLTEVLAGWMASRASAAEAVSIVGPRWDARTHDLAGVFAQIAIPHGVHEVDSEAGRQLMRLGRQPPRCWDRLIGPPMSFRAPRRNTSQTNHQHEEANVMDFKLELVLLPVTDVDRAKMFYSDSAGFRLEVDTGVEGVGRVVQLGRLPPGD
jgi:hypothetical protein